MLSQSIFSRVSARFGCLWQTGTHRIFVDGRRSVSSMGGPHPLSRTQKEDEALEKDILEKRQKDLPNWEQQNPYKNEPRKCILCKHQIHPDFKNIRLLSQFVSSYTGLIYGRHITGLCEEMQKRVEAAIRKARNYGFMPVHLKEPCFLRDPKLFNPDNPLRPHKY